MRFSPVVQIAVDRLCLARSWECVGAEYIRKPFTVNERDASVSEAMWSDEELERITRLELSVGCVRAINQSLQASFPNRSVESMESAHKQCKYFARFCDSGNDENEKQSPEEAEKASKICDMMGNIRALAISDISACHGPGRDILEVLSRGVVEEVRTFLESYLKCPEPHQRQPVIFRDGGSSTLRGRKMRQKEYTDMQHLWKIGWKKSCESGFVWSMACERLRTA